MGVDISEIDENGATHWRIVPGARKGSAKVDVGNAGTVMRFLPPVAALGKGAIAFDGDERSHLRPLAPVIRALEELGVVIDHGERYSLPIVVHGEGELRGGEIDIDASASSQFLSSLLLIGPSTLKGITARHVGPAMPSAPHIEMTVGMLRDYGAEVEVDSSRKIWRVHPSRLRGRNFVIEPDLSNAAPFLAIAMICGGKVTIADWPKDTTQPGDQLRMIFSEMGAEINFSENGLTITGTGAVHGIDVDLHDVGELTPSIAAVAALSDSPSTLRGIGHLRLHETDRLDALTREINRLGGSVSQSETSLHIIPQPMHGGIFRTYEDHRLATAGAIIGLVTKDVEVENIDTTSKTMPNFPSLWAELISEVTV